MFEVGKLSDDTLDCFLYELEQVLLIYDLLIIVVNNSIQLIE